MQEPHNTVKKKGANGKLIKYGIYVAVAAILFFVIKPIFFKAPRPEVEKPQLRHLKAIRVISSRLERMDQLPGEIQAYQDVAIYPKVAGFIKWIGIDRGSIVKKDQFMVGLFAPELIAQSNEAYAKEASAKNQLFEAESKLAAVRAERLQAVANLKGDDDTYQRIAKAAQVPGVVAENEVVVLREKVEADKQRIHQLDNAIKAQEKQIDALADAVKATHRASNSFKQISEYLVVTAPFDGFITERNMHVGSFVGPLGKGAYPPIVRIQQLDLLRIVAPVPEALTGGIEPGAPVQFSVSTYPGQVFTGAVARLGNYLEQKTRTMPVELNYFNKDLKIFPGMFCEIYWPTKRDEKTLFVPTTAVQNTSLIEKFVLRIRNNRVEWVKVTTGQSMGLLTEIFGDIAEGDIVAVEGSDEIQPNTEVTYDVIEEKSLVNPDRPTYLYH